MTKPEITNYPLHAARRWLAVTLSTIALLLLINLVVVWRMDVFGILRDTSGRSLPTGQHERTAKYLLNTNYVPENFDALMIGTSASINWRLNELTGYHFYNESLEAGNATEERIMVERALKNGHYKVALVGLSTKVTQVHRIEDGLDRVKQEEAFGSLSSYGLMLTRILGDISHRRSDFYADGSHEMGADFVHGWLPTHPPAPPRPGDLMLDISNDTKAVADYRAMVQDLQAKGVLVIYVVYPLYGPFYEYNKDVFAQYLQNALEVMPPLPVINLNGPEFKSFRIDATNFIDDEHLTKKGSVLLTAMINEKMHEILNDHYKL